MVDIDASTCTCRFVNKNTLTVQPLVTDFEFKPKTVLKLASLHVHVHIHNVCVCVGVFITLTSCICHACQMAVHTELDEFPVMSL